MKKEIYAGTYTAKNSEGIYAFSFDEGKLSDVRLHAKIRNPKYIAVRDDLIITAGDFENGSGVALVDMEGNIIDRIAYESRTSCYVTEKDGRIYTANYHEGTFTVLEIQDRHLKLVQTVRIRDGAGCHQVLLWKDRILVPCLFLDRVMIYDQDLKRLGSIYFNQGVGPRHGIFSEDGEYLYLVSELSNELFVIHAGDWEILHAISVLPDGQKHLRDTAAIRLSADGKHIYVSTRTLDILSVIELDGQKPELIQTVSCGGKHPRDFIREGEYILSANRFTNDVVCFALNPDGTIGEQTGSVTVPEVVSLSVR